MDFSYKEFTTRNIGFVTKGEQDRLKNANLFVCGTGGMGGAAIMALVRAGVGSFTIADLDEFEVSNLNRQLFCTMKTVAKHKAEATRDACLDINPEAKLNVYHDDWPDHIETAIEAADIVINGTDDLGASLLIYRTARKFKKTVVDAYASPLPSVYVTRAHEKMPEERLGYPTINTNWNEITDEQRLQSFLREAEYVIINSSSRKHIDNAIAGEVAAGVRSRMSFAPMVISTGMLMAYECIGGILGRQSPTDAQGWFFNPYSARIERPTNPLLAATMRPFVRRFMQRLMAQ
ncbi:HesA/MoeB/ThiF family protein [Maritalea myrionectae]|uniref:HesA/MoeB/ThiF family protein n=1 Tax=Maritalea myrionectae TaxID=454601 RepID=UPI000423C83E|nr:ThiF family adenylyltransferase [Maritalea myrionectae]